MNNNINKYIPAVIVVLLLVSIVMNGVILSRLSKSGTNTIAASNSVGNPNIPSNPNVSSPNASGSAGAVTPAGLNPQAPLADTGTEITGIVLTLAGTAAPSADHADLAQASSWLSSNGFSVTATATTTLTFSGTAGNIQKAFGNQIGKYSENGSVCYSGVPAGNTIVTVPAKLASIVGAITLPKSCL